MSVKVAIRVRPFNQRQKFLGCICCVEMRDSTTILYQNKEKNKKQHYFTFDYSIWSHDQFTLRHDGYMMPTTNKYIDQQRVYNIIGKEMLQNAWQGYNCCLFAYGQTGAGKSYSMIGYGVNRGIIPMICEEIFQKIKKYEQKGQKQYQITLSMLEIYNQKVQDLFVPTGKRPPHGLKIRQNKTLGVYVEGLTKYQVYSYADIQHRMDQGSKNKSLASTLMNEYSSRAHTIIMLQFVQKEWINKLKMNKKSSFINLVDLAGSQRVSKTGISNNKDRLKQASNINKSLHTLGRVIQVLAEQGAGKNKNAQVPYRDSALTRILEGALGGNSKTIMICAISPANDNYEQTLSTLRYADQTKKIKNKPIVNESAVDKIIRQLRQENERLKKMLDNPDENSLANSRQMHTESEKKEIRSNLRASMREVQKQIKKNLKSFAINTQIQEQQESLMMTQFIDLQQPSQFFSELSFDLGNKAQVYITNLNEDEQLNYKIRYSCQRDLLITNKNNKKAANGMEQLAKIVLCGLGVQQNHAKIIRKGDRYFIDALTQTSAEYTLLNGKPVYERRQLEHNDRIILGINSVFVFKNNLRKAQNKQVYVDYQYAMNERQKQMENLSLIPPSSLNLFLPSSFLRDNKSKDIYANPPNKALNATKKLLGPQNQTQILSKIEQIESEFSKLVKQNQDKMKQKQDYYRNRLSELKKQKQKQKQQKTHLEQKLMIKSIQSESLRTKNSELQNLKKKLSKFVDQKNRRAKVRQSMLLQSDDNRIQQDVIGQFIEVQDPRQRNNAKKTHDFGVGGNNYQKTKSKKDNRVSITQEYQDVIIEQFQNSQQLVKTVINPRESTDSLLLNDEQNYYKETKQTTRTKQVIKNQIFKKIQANNIQLLKLQQRQQKILMFQFRRLYNIKILCEIEQDQVCSNCSSRLYQNKQSSRQQHLLAKYVPPSEYDDVQLEQLHFKNLLQKKKKPTVTQQQLLLLQQHIQQLQRQLLIKEQKQKKSHQSQISQDELLLNFSVDRSSAHQSGINPRQSLKPRQSFSLRKFSNDQEINFCLSQQPQFPQLKSAQLKIDVCQFIQILADLPELNIYQQSSVKFEPVQKRKKQLKIQNQLLQQLIFNEPHPKGLKYVEIQDLSITIFNHKKSTQEDKANNQNTQPKYQDSFLLDQNLAHGQKDIVSKDKDIQLKIQIGVNTDIIQQQFINDKIKGTSFTAFLSEQLEQTNQNQTQSFNQVLQKQKIVRQLVQFGTNTQFSNQNIGQQYQQQLILKNQIITQQIGILAIDDKIFADIQSVTDINMTNQQFQSKDKEEEQNQVLNYIHRQQQEQNIEEKSIKQTEQQLHHNLSNNKSFHDVSINTSRLQQIQKIDYQTSTQQIKNKQAQTNTSSINLSVFQAVNICIENIPQTIIKQQSRSEEDQIQRYMKDKQDQKQRQSESQDKKQKQNNIIKLYQQVAVNTNKPLYLYSQQVQVQLNDPSESVGQQSPIRKLKYSQEQRILNEFKLGKISTFQIVESDLQLTIYPSIQQKIVSQRQLTKQQLRQSYLRQRPQMIDQQIQFNSTNRNASVTDQQIDQNKKNSRLEVSNENSVKRNKNSRNKSMEIEGKLKQLGNSQQLADKFNSSVSDIEKHDFSYQQLSVFGFDGLLKEDELSNKIKLLQEKIKQLQAQSQIKQAQQPKVQIKGPPIQEPAEQIRQQTPEMQQIRNSLKQITKKDEQQYQKQKHTPPLKRNKKKKKKQQMTPQERKEHQIQKQLQAKIIQCNNQNLINQRNLQIHKRKRETEQLRKILIKKQKVQLQKQLLVLIPMIRRFNLIARQMKRLIEGKISVQYRSFSHYQMVQILKTYSKNKKNSGDNIQIKIVILNCEEGRIYTWPVDVFKNRYEIAEQSFEKYLELDQDMQSGRNRFLQDRSEKSKDPFWDPVDYIAQGVGYLSIQPLAYGLSYEGYISIIYKSAIIAKLYVNLTPVKVKKQHEDQSFEQQVQQESEMQNIEIYNNRNLLQKQIYFTISIQSIKFMKNQQRQKADESNQNINLNSLNSNILKYTISYQLLENDYKLNTFNTPQIDFVIDKQFKRIDYMRRHSLQNISEATLAYISDCPIKFTLNVMKDYNQQCLNASFTEDYSQSDNASSELDISHASGTSQGIRPKKNSVISAKDLPKQHEMPAKSDFSKKPNMIYENTEVVTRLETQAKKQQQKRDKVKKLQQSRSRLAKQQKQRQKDKDKDCNIY